jgi:alanyl-tRNA synthetase
MISNSFELRSSYLKFFNQKDHKTIPSAPLIPEDDSSTLFISAGMHPLVPFLMGLDHPLGKKLVGFQKCLRTEDIEAVGSSYRHTFFEMLGNWSLGDYYKKESIAYSWEFLTKVLNIDTSKIFVTIFEGDEKVPFDQESKDAWLSVGLDEKKIIPLGREDNWWQAGVTGPGGPDTEIYYDTGINPCSKNCLPPCKCGKYFEIWNNVFMEYNQQEDGKLVPLKQKNVDTGMGVERVTAILQGKNDNFLIDLLFPLIDQIEKMTGLKYGSNEEVTKQMRIVADHIRAATFVINDGVEPGNVKQGYVLRRLIRRAVRQARRLKINGYFTKQISDQVVNVYKDIYPELEANSKQIFSVLENEEKKFANSLQKGLVHFEKEYEKIKDNKIPGNVAFDLYQTYGFPLEMIIEEAESKNPQIKVNTGEFDKLLQAHQEKSRKSAKGLFKGGLSDQSEDTVKLHTATHLLHWALREHLGSQIKQTGSAITPEKLRFDFSWDNKLTKEDLEKIESMVQGKIDEGYEVKMEIMPFKKAVEKGATALFKDRYPEKVSVYSIGDFSTEICRGPHVKNLSELGKFKIIKEQSSSSGVRRIYAALEKI